MKTLVAQAIPRRDSDEGVAAVGIRESRNSKLRHFRQLRESRSSKSVLDLQQSFPLRNMSSYGGNFVASKVSGSLAQGRGQ